MKNEKLLKKFISEAIANVTGSQPYESYDHDLLDDDAFNEKSVYVPLDIKNAIKKWMIDMGLTGRNLTRSS